MAFRSLKARLAGRSGNPEPLRLPHPSKRRRSTPPRERRQTRWGGGNPATGPPPQASAVLASSTLQPLSWLGDKGLVARGTTSVEREASTWIAEAPRPTRDSRSGPLTSLTRSNQNPQLAHSSLARRLVTGREKNMFNPIGFALRLIGRFIAATSAKPKPLPDPQGRQGAATTP